MFRRSSHQPINLSTYQLSNMNFPEHLKIEDFNYLLPPERIAQYPLDKRDSSKLLIWKDGNIEETIFSSVDDYIPDCSMLVFNDTKVIRARLIFTKDTGATIEIFCLEPVLPTAEIQGAFHQTIECTWLCLVGNVKRWKEGILQKEILFQDQKYILDAEKKEDKGDGHFLIKFRWNPSSLTFSEILEFSGKVPLPPYIIRGDSALDTFRYQTIYAKHEGSVAAPTAGLHFTEQVMNRLERKNISFEKIALHVGVGTFRPVSTLTLSEHIMHSEKIIVSLSSIRNLIQHLKNPVVAIGTTSVRTLESLYWLGVKLLARENKDLPEIHQWDAYDKKYADQYPTQDALHAVENYLIQENLEVYSGRTQLMIVPGYKFRIVNAMITNFHMPQSTLLLLVAAFIGEDWKKVYQYALNKDFRFLSYGDTCLFFLPKEPIL
jgi:S-adenosylmethionine:tRNA ribosyltransferase-isomerase